MIRCLNEDCGHEVLASGKERIYKGKAVIGHGYMVLCKICNCQTILIDDKVFQEDSH